MIDAVAAEFATWSRGVGPLLSGSTARQFAPPRLGRAAISGNLLTRFHDGGTEARPFRGRLSGFLLMHAAVKPD